MSILILQLHFLLSGPAERRHAALPAEADVQLVVGGQFGCCRSCGSAAATGRSPSASPVATGSTRSNVRGVSDILGLSADFRFRCVFVFVCFLVLFVNVAYVRRWKRASQSQSIRASTKKRQPLRFCSANSMRRDRSGAFPTPCRPHKRLVPFFLIM